MTVDLTLPALASATSLADVIALVRTTARDLADAQGATFVLRDGDRCFYADEDSIAPLWKGQRFPMTECISGWAMLNDDVAVVPNVFADPRVPAAAYRPTYVVSLVMVPVGAPPLGAIGAYWAKPHHATDAQVGALRRLAADAAAAIDRVGLDSAPWAPSFR